MGLYTVSGNSTDLKHGPCCNKTQTWPLEISQTLNINMASGGRLDYPHQHGTMATWQHGLLTSTELQASGCSTDRGHPHGPWWQHRFWTSTQTPAIRPWAQTWPSAVVQDHTSSWPQVAGHIISICHPTQPPKHDCGHSFRL